MSEENKKFGAVQKVKSFQVELNQNVDISRFLNKQKGHPKVENTTYWTAPSFHLDIREKAKGEEKPEEELMGKRKSSPRLATTSSD